MEAWRRELYHHGIKGQRWGVRRGPPYPIGDSGSSRSKSVKSVGKPAGNANGSDENSRKRSKFHLTGKQKAALFIGAEVAGIAALAIMASGGDISVMAADGKQLARKALAKLSGKTIEELSPFKFRKKTGPRTLKSIIHDVKLVNPKASHSNCVACSVVNDLRARGYDVIAKTKSDDSAFSLKDVARLYKNFKLEALTETGVSHAYDSIRDHLLSYGEGARGCFFGTYADERVDSFMKRHPDNKRDYRGLGHAFSWEILNGKIVLYDGQGGFVYADNRAVINAFNPNKLKFARLDNLEVCPDFMEIFAENRQS